LMVSRVCSRSHGQPPGARSRAMISTSFWNFSPAVDDKFQFSMASRSGQLRCPPKLAARWNKTKFQAFSRAAAVPFVCGMRPAGPGLRSRYARFEGLEVRQALRTLLFLFLQILGNPGEVVIKPRGVDFPRRPHSFTVSSFHFIVLFPSPLPAYISSAPRTHISRQPFV
jgi:hypothetical protein